MKFGLMVISLERSLITILNILLKIGINDTKNLFQLKFLSSQNINIILSANLTSNKYRSWC